VVDWVVRDWEKKVRTLEDRGDLIQPILPNQLRTSLHQDTDTIMVLQEIGVDMVVTEEVIVVVTGEVIAVVMEEVVAVDMVVIGVDTEEVAVLPEIDMVADTGVEIVVVTVEEVGMATIAVTTAEEGEEEEDSMEAAVVDEMEMEEGRGIEVAAPAGEMLFQEEGISIIQGRGRGKVYQLDNTKCWM